MNSIVLSIISFILLSRNLTGEDGLFKEKELENMEKKIVEVETWRDEKVQFVCSSTIVRLYQIRHEDYEIV